VDLNKPIALTFLLAVLAACSPIERAGPAAPGGPVRRAHAAEEAYRTPPTVSDAQPEPGGRILLEGLADPGSRIRLATPAGQAVFAKTDSHGVWRAALAQASTLRLFGLSMAEDRGVFQSESYLALTPAGLAVQLRSGAGAVVLGAPCATCLTALDFDRKGGAVVSGRAPPGAVVSLSLDGVPRGRVAADRQGRYSLDLDEPLEPGLHHLVVAGAGGLATAAAQVTAPVALTSGPFAAGDTPSGWRIEWVTPGGGVQTTLVFERGAPA
jgi:hypothetical protein